MPKVGAFDISRVTQFWDENVQPNDINNLFHPMENWTVAQWKLALAFAEFYRQYADNLGTVSRKKGK
jgi:hypothetical protein